MLKVVQRSWDELKPHPNNPRNGDVDAIAQSLAKNGQYKPIVTTPDGTVLAGNHTYMAAGQLGLNDMSCVVLDIEPHSPEAMRIMLVDNRTSDLASYDDSQLADLLVELESTDLGLLGTGYSDEDLKKLQESLSLTDTLDELPDNVGAPTIVVTCSTETEQEELLEEFLRRGIEAKGMFV